MNTVEIKQNASLQDLNSLALPAYAEYFCSVSGISQIQQALAFAREKGLQVTPLGGGSNMVIAGDIQGLVLHLDLKGMSSKPVANDQIEVTFAAGENWHEMVQLCLQKGWYGLENLALIPGNMGAAPIQNIGAYGVELCDLFVSLQAIEISTGELMVLDNKQCQFGYRDSVFKQAYKDRFLITHVCLRLSTQPTAQVQYPALAEALGDKAVTPELVSETVCRIRQQKLPDPADLPNAGSFFKNPLVSESGLDRLQSNGVQSPRYAQLDGTYKIPAAWLIDQCGFRGQRRGNVGVHEHQALVLVNYGGTGNQLLALATEIQDAVFAKFGIALEIEPRLYGV
ncbi:UDP-N-acetylmuramate dehydrogenase [Porticoccaceae bacterium]|nr:UDP-N-acetylmuramate dehydrogenase [Porticoccaceae bacterium]